MKTKKKKQNAWVKTATRLPTSGDADAKGMVMCRFADGVECLAKFSLVSPVTVPQWRRSSAG